MITHRLFCLVRFDLLEMCMRIFQCLVLQQDFRRGFLADSAGISSETVVSKWNGKHVAIVVTVIGTIAAIVYPMDNITDFLYLIGSVFAPMIAIQIADFFLLKRDKSSLAVHIPNLIIWVIGFVVYRILMNIDMPLGNTLPDMVITIVICLIVGKFVS